jgi:hypothetical protein
LLQFRHSQFNMSSIWIVAAGALALAAAAAVAHVFRRDPGGGWRRSMLSGVSEEWLSNARSQRDESW